MFNIKNLFSKFSNGQCAIIWQSSTEQKKVNYDEVINASKIVNSALHEFIKNGQNKVGVLLHHSTEIIPVILG